MEALAPLLLAALIFLPFYFLMVRPHQRRIREHDALVEALTVGDEVMTTSGLYGIIRGLDAEVARVEIAPEVEVRVARRAIGRRLERGESAA